MKQGPLIILCGPSGSGKSTVIGRLLAEGGLPLHLSVSATTRKKRPGEENGVHYHFWTQGQFEEHLRAGDFLEHARVHGQCYGTLRSEVDSNRARGMGILLDIDVQGAEQVRRLYPEALAIFLKVSSPEVYEKRLRARGEPADSIARRMVTARAELAREHEFTHVVVNDDLQTAVEQVRRLIEQAFKQGNSHAG
jgi:guanylate kinase